MLKSLIAKIRNAYSPVLFRRWVRAIVGYNKEKIEAGIESIFKKPCYRHGMCLFLDDSERYWKLKHILAKWL